MSVRVLDADAGLATGLALFILGIGVGIAAATLGRRRRRGEPVDPVLDLLATAPDEDETLSEDEVAEMAAGLDEAARGEWTPYAEVQKATRVPA